MAGSFAPLVQHLGIMGNDNRATAVIVYTSTSVLLFREQHSLKDPGWSHREPEILLKQVVLEVTDSTEVMN